MVAIQPRISLFLGALDTTIMHRAGMAGLYMTLQRLEEKYPDPHQRAGHFLWKMTPDTIELSWQGSDVVALYWLLKESFKLDRKGLIHLTGIENNTTNLRQKIHIHEGICAVFLRHNKFFNATKLSTAKIRIETQEIDYKYKPLTWYSHQSFARTLCEINTGKLEKDYLQITSWLYLGGIVRHARASKTTKLEEKPEYAFALLFVPVICQYFLLNLFSEELKKKHPQRYLVVIPDVNNFERASQRRRELQRLSIEQFYVNSMEEAGLIYYSLDEDKEDEIHDRICQVLLYEKINQASRQRTLTRVEEIVIDRELLLTEKLIEQYFQPNFQRVSSKDILIKVNTVRSLIRENLVKRLPWWSNFWKKLVEDDQKGYLLKQLLYNKRGLKMMIENSDTTEKYLIFVALLGLW
jgi:CRISPR-associated protein Cas8a1/Csx13